MDKIDMNLFENIIVAKPEDMSIFDEIEAQEEKMGENKDLYDAYLTINKVLDSPSRYNEIQSVAPAIDVNKGILTIDGVCKHDVKANRQDLNRVEDMHTNMTGTTAIIDEFVNDLAQYIPVNLNIEYSIEDDNLPKMDKTRFKVIISRK